MRRLHGGGFPARKLLAQRAHKVEKSLPSRAREILAQFQKGKQIFLSLRPAVHRAEDAEHVALTVNFTQQLAHAQVRGTVAQRSQHRKKRFAVPVLAQKQRVIEVARALLRAKRCKLIGHKTEQRRAQHSDQRHILARIVDHLQKREQHRDLHRGKKVLTRIGGTADPARFQRAAIVQKARARRTHQYDDVLLAHRPQLPRFIVLYRKFA